MFDSWALLLIGGAGGWMGGLYSLVAPPRTLTLNDVMSAPQYWIVFERQIKAHWLGLPAYSFRLKEVWVAPIDDYDLMVFVQETLNGRLGRPCDITPKPSAVAGPPEGIALAVLLGEHQQHLRRQEGMGARVRQCWDWWGWWQNICITLYLLHWQPRTRLKYLLHDSDGCRHLWACYIIL